MTTTLIWGINGGIGRALAARLMTEGHSVLGAARDTSRLSDLNGLIPIEADVADPFSVQQAVLTAGQEASEIDLWVYSAGDILSAKIDSMQPEQWSRIINANLTGAYLTTHYSLPLLAPDAHLFYLGAVSERLRLPGLSAYGAAKAGLEAFVEAIGKEERKRKFTVIRPGAVVTPLWDKVPLKLPKDAMSAEKVADKLIEAYQSGHKGQLDLTH
ncbi:MAG: SDR family NAD(P)-dependent oxidoreductase [Chloroflexi bacterium]|nr:SDR family NAD(P)-dependent oxidoreductase [Chloroflexota bacterium]